MDQYIYKTFKMLQNGLYWSFYCCFSIWIFVQIVKIRCNLYFAQFTSAGERLPEPVSNGQTISKLSPPTHQRTRSRPHPTWETKLYLPVPLKDTKESNESSRRLFLQLSTIQPLNAKKKKKSDKKELCMREANQKLW